MKKRKICLLILLFFLCANTLKVSFAGAEDGKFPRKYDLREQKRVTPVKEQGELGSCWAMTSIAALESSLITKEGKEYDLSENNLITQTSDIYEDGFDRSYDSGGDDALACAYYASWRGPVSESDDPYSKTIGSTKIVTGKKEVKHVQEVVFLPQRKNALDNDLIKEHVMKYGAVSISMWKGTPQTFGEFYNEDKFAWYYPYNYANKEGNGHAVDIVGWDDDFPKENFKVPPEGNGAFIVKNTKGPLWGQENRKKNMGGYFYISYYDMMLGSKLDSNVGSAVFTRVDGVNNYSNIYQYDILGYTKAITMGREASFANVFTIDKGINEKLSAASFYTLEENLNYEIWVNTDFNDKNSFGNMIKIKSGDIKLPGYHTIDLDSKIDLVKDKKVAVVVKLISKDFNPSIALESPKGLMSSKAKAGKGQSYIFNNTGEGWVDFTSLEKDTNVCIKVFTTNGSEDESKLLKASDMKKDVDYLVSWTRTHQPVAKVSGYTKKQKDTINWVYSKIAKPMTKEEFYLIINRLFTMMGEGHTNMHNWFEGTKRLEIPFVWLQDGPVINLTYGNYLVGDRILSIGGKTPEELTNMLYEQISSENDYWIHAQAPYYLAIDAYLKYFNLINSDNTVDIKIERDNKVIIVRQPLINDGESFYNVRNWLSWHIEKENNLGYFQFDEWPSGEKLDEMEKNMDDFFIEVSKNKIRNIVFDIRENPGGTSGALNYMFKYLDRGKVYIENNVLYGMDKIYPKASKEFIYKGNIYFMISNQTFSCSVLATTIMKDSGIVKVIGEPSGENPTFSHHGESSDGKLPSIGWKFMMTSYKPKSRPYNKNINDKAIFPDIPVYTTKDDIVSGRDIQLERMREIAKGEYVYTKGTIETVKDNKISIIEGNSFTVDKDENVVINIKTGGLSKENIWMESSIEHKRIPVDIEKASDRIIVKLPDSLKMGETCHLVINSENKNYAVLLSVKPDKIISKNNIFTMFDSAYAKEFKYLSINFSKDIKNEIDINKIIVKDKKGNKVLVTYAENGIDCKNDLIVQIDSNSSYTEPYTLFIPKNTVESIDGDKYDEDINISFTVDNI